MNRIHIQMTTLAALLALTGCAKEFENTTDERDGSAIELSSVSTDPMTKAVITGTSFTTDEAAAGIGLFLLDGSGIAYGKNAGNVKYDFNSGKWTAASPLRVGNTEGTLVGYYPYSGTATNVKAIPVASSINGTDYLYGSITGLTSAKAKTESLSLSHALARLRISFKRDASFVGTGTLSSLTIEGDGIAASGTLDATSGVITATKSAFTVSGLNATITTVGLTEDCLVVPAAASDTPQAITLRFTVDGKGYKVDLTDGLAVKLQSGIQTDITLTVKNTSVTVDGASIGAWGDGGTQTVTVGGNYKVKIQYADIADITKDVTLTAYADGNDVIVKAYSTSGQHLKCTMPDGEFCTGQSNTTYKDPKDNTVSRYEYTFTISDITENTTATIGYAEKVDDIAVSPAGVGCKVTVVNGELYEGELVRLVPNAAYSYGISNWKDQNGNVLCDGYDYTVRLSKDVQITACFEENLILGGEFSVKDDKGNVKKVRFTRGNLYCNNRTQYEIEQHQYDFNPIYTNDAGYISHFMWSNNKGYARFTQYDSRWDGQGPLFTEAEDFKVIDAAHCLSIDEWSYLVNERAASTVNSMANARYFMGCVQKDDGKSINGMFLFPDEFTWPESVIAHPSGINGPVNEFSDNNYSYNDLKRLQDAGVVFLPAAGYRDGGNGPYADNYMIYNVGRSGFYWSSTKSKESATFIWINSSGISLKSAVLSKAYSIRLVTESN